MAEIVIALDVSGEDRALELVDLLGAEGHFYKVGLELYTRAGPSVLRELHDRGKRIFLDLKLHDIPNTVAGAVRSAAGQGADLLTVHAVGGEAMIAAAAEAARRASEEEGHRLQILAVTVLTSLSAADVEATWNRSILSVRDEVVRLADLAVSAGADGVVASALEARALRRHLGKAPVLATPGIRLEEGASHDQSRVATPAAAVEAGADYLVVGRPVTLAADPRAALRRLEDALPAAPSGPEGEP